ncbi:glycosyltransferase family 4 protein [Paracoccaceae bacterium Fryx2]|nr:glycosyltransferase family 4 protein [Paracoccaceae bacterium Fryx2]
MKLLILTNYFTPDLSAGSFRMQALIEALENWREKGLEVDLITTRPNRYASLKAEAPLFEDRGWLRIHRIELPAHKGGMADQARSYAHYAIGVRRLTSGQRWDLVFATSSRLMTAGLGAHVARRMRGPLYLDIRDLFTLNMDELLVGSPLKMLLPVFRRIERQAFWRAGQINVVSEGFIPHLRAIAPKVPIRCFTNGIDDLFLSEDFERSETRHALPLLLYAGNMGEGQGLHRILPQAAKALEGRVRFRLIGGGGKRLDLEAALRAQDITNVEVLPPVARDQLLAHYCEADILFLHLNDLDAFRKVLPSKIFEYAATGKPILAGVAGYAADFLRKEVPNAAVFAPCDADAMAKAALSLLAQSETPDRGDFCKAYARTTIMAEMAADILATVPEGRKLTEAVPSLIGDSL